MGCLVAVPVVAVDEGGQQGVNLVVGPQREFGLAGQERAGGIDVAGSEGGEKGLCVTHRLARPSAIEMILSTRARRTAHGLVTR